MKVKKLLLLVCAFAPNILMAQNNSITETKYWIDHQIGNWQTLTESPAEIDLSDYSYGVHAITASSKDEKGVWSCPVTQYFVITSTVTPATSIEQREYWIDGNVNGRVSLPDAIALIDLSAYSDGVHSITVRVKDDKGIWSSPVTQFFVIMSETPTTTMTSYCYWFDDNSANAVNSKLPAASGLMDIDVSGLSYYTEHTLHLAVCDSKGAYSMVMEEIFIIEPITTSISEAQNLDRVNNGDWFTLEGVKLDSRPTERGIYIRNGKKIIIK